MSLDHISASNAWSLPTENHAHAPVNDWDVAGTAGIGEGNDAHATWESAWIDIGGEG